jgi:hypothetical protein
VIGELLLSERLTYNWELPDSEERLVSSIKMEELVRKAASKVRLRSAKAVALKSESTKGLEVSLEKDKESVSDPATVKD